MPGTLTSPDTGTIWSTERVDLWDEIVDEFTSRKLTFPSDRLSAILGMASRLRQDCTRNGRYVAGLWEAHLNFELLWRVAYPPQTNYGVSVQPNLHISTWSWAHRNSKVYTYRRLGATSSLVVPPKFILDGIDQDLQSQESLMTVPSCKISLDGYLQKVGSTAVQVDSIPEREIMTATVHYPGLPGESSSWNFDHEPLAPGPYYCLRMTEDATGGRMRSMTV